MSKPRRSEITLDGFDGLNELLSPFDLGRDEELSWLVTAQNVDIDDGRSVRRRPGTTKIGSYTDPHSLWSNGEQAFFAGGGNLHLVDQINSTTVSTTQVITGAGPSKFDYVEAHDQIYFSNDKKNGMLLSNGTFHNWAVETPQGQPTLATTTGAINIDCSISVFVTFIDDLGRESGASGIATLHTDSETGVSLTNIPVPSGSDIDSKAVYCTPPDGDVFYLAKLLSPNDTTTSITNFNHLTVQEWTLFLSEPPKGNILAFESGRVYIADGKYLYRSQPLVYHLFNLREDYFPFNEDISIIAPVDGGLFVTADKTYFISTVQEVPELDVKLGYGGVTGTLTFVDGEKIGAGQGETWALWVGGKGIVAGGPEGQIRNITEDRTAIQNATEGGMLVREDGGYTRAIASFRSGEASGIRATDYVSATVTKCPAISTENTADNYFYTADNTNITADAE